MITLKKKTTNRIQFESILRTITKYNPVTKQKHILIILL